MMIKPPNRMRLNKTSSEIIDRSETLAFEFDDFPVKANSGDTVASALYASGVKTFSRSFKYHRRRGLLCVAGRCANCMVTVDGVPNVRACTTPVMNGMKVKYQNAWPSLEFDLFSVLDRLDKLMPVGFYYKIFHRPKWAWKIVSSIIRRVGGLGKVDTKSISTTTYRHIFQHSDVAVIGGGPSGMSAALSLAKGGLRVVIIDDQPVLGGHLLFDKKLYKNLPDISELHGYEVGEFLANQVNSSEKISIISSATVFGFYEGNLLGILCDDRIIKLRAQHIVVTTGSYEIPLVFDGNDLPGVILGTGAQRLINLYGIKIGKTAIVATNNIHGYYVAKDLLESGTAITAIVDSRPELQNQFNLVNDLKSRGVLILNEHTITRSHGKGNIDGVTVARLKEGKTTTQERHFSCDILSMSGGFQAADSILRQVSSEFAYDEILGEMIPSDLPTNVYAAGDVTGIHDLRASILQGRLIGAEVLSNLGFNKPNSPHNADSLRNELLEIESDYRINLHETNSVPKNLLGSKNFVCFCEDVTSKDIVDGISEGFSDIQTLKRYSTVTMGPCQGKMCLKSFASICSQKTNQTLDEIGLTTARPPVAPVPLGALAGPSHMPIKHTALHNKHIDLGAEMIDVGQWQRPYKYISSQDEALAIRHGVGIIDVSTLGKLDISGRDSPEFLDKIYTNNFSNLKIGRVRYGLLCSDNGTIMDDGTVTRISENNYFVTTSTLSVDLIEEWFKWWLAGTGKCVHITNVTSGFSAINVAGPKSRQTLEKLTDVDLSAQAFQYMSAVNGTVAGVKCIFMKIGFVGETGWELHFPSEYAEHVWDALMDAGKEFNIVPCGLESQRILRLEKKHIIPNQDTDLVSNPLATDSEWAVKFEKEDFIGRAGLVGIRDRGIKNKLIGFVMCGSDVPQDGVPVIKDGVPVGRVTSSRLSPILEKGFGFAWVPSELATEGTEISIRVDGRLSLANVTNKPFYDPQGKRLRD